MYLCRSRRILALSVQLAILRATCSCRPPYCSTRQSYRATMYYLSKSEAITILLIDNHVA